jgi:rhodanese-related sulfurtransferase
MLNKTHIKMRNILKFKFWMLAILITPFFLASCDNEEEEPPAINEAEVLVNYLEDPTSPAANYGNSGLAIKSAEAVHTLLAAGKVTVIDIRSSTDFDDGHIDGAVNMPAGDVRDYIDGLASYDEISIVCYTGQTASWLTSLLQLAGYKDVYSMKWGMSGWHSDFDKWTANTNSDKVTLFKNEVTEKGAEGDLPTLSTGFEEGADIFEARFDVVLAEGFGPAAISQGDVYANLDNYYIINYWPNDYYLDPGHIEGAMQYTPNVDLASDAALKTLPTDKTVVVYCFTGQNSARIAAYLRIIGYDAKSLKFGANSMIWSDMPASKWTDAAPMEYDYVGMK